jgi:PAP2 superfamily
MWRSTGTRTVVACRKTLGRRRHSALAGFLLAATCLQPAGANEVLKWNDTAAKAATAGGQNNIQITRTIAMVQGAVHDALNAINPRYTAYYFEGPATAGASPDAAVAAATYTVLVSVIPNFGAPPQRAEGLAQVEAAYKAALSAVADETARTRGVTVGTAAGEAMLALRKDDGATKGAPYTPSTVPGRWRPHPNPDPPNPPIKDPKLAPGMAASALPGWGNVTPFTMLSTSQFWLPGPPALNSAAYARDFNEVKNIGGQVSTLRTPEQTEIARFWYEGPSAWYRITRAAAEARGLDPWDSARLLGLVSLAMADSFISGFKIRYVYDLWRPVTAIREADTDGNDATVADATWNSHQNTPPVSDYPSTQSIFSGAASVVLASVLATDQVPVTVTSGPPFANIKRSFTSFSHAARESADSRVYAGIHFRSACEDGLVLGRRIGARAASMYLQPLPKAQVASR